jgi:hypothetical protein
VISGSVQKSFCTTDRVVLHAALIGISGSPFGNAASYLEGTFCLSWREHNKRIIDRASFIKMFHSRGFHDANLASLGSNLSWGLIHVMEFPGSSPCENPPMGGNKGSTLLRWVFGRSLRRGSLWREEGDSTADSVLAVLFGCRRRVGGVIRGYRVFGVFMVLDRGSDRVRYGNHVCIRPDRG